MPRMRLSDPAPPADGAIGRLTELDGEHVLPVRVRTRLNNLFAQIEKEFEVLYNDNIALHRELEMVQEKSDLAERYEDTDGGGKNKQKLMNAAQKLKPGHKLKQQTSRIVSSFKPSSTVCSVVREFRGHKDGIWHVTAGRADQCVICTASADHTARVWSVETGRCLLIYSGHSGSVNSVRCHPTRDLVLSASGDQTAHIWQAAVVHDNARAVSSEDEVDENNDLVSTDCGTPGGSAAVSGGTGGSAVAGPVPVSGAGGSGGKEMKSILRTPLLSFNGHSAVVIGADWVSGAEQVVTASWDRTGHVYDVATGECVNTLTGHDRELTHVSAHPTQRFVVTASRDTTFRLWDFREPMPCVSVFQGHTDTVTSAVFTYEDKLVSGSDDRCCKVWDLKNMRLPVATMRGDAAVNRLDVSQSHLVAAPFDNRHIRIYDLSGQRLCRLPRSNRVGHRRMVTAVAWGDDSMPSQPNLFSCGFDNVANGWIYAPGKDKD